MATDEEIAAAVERAEATAAGLKGRPAVTPDGVVLGTFSGGWDVKRADGSIVYTIEPTDVGGRELFESLLDQCEADTPTVVGG